VIPNKPHIFNALLLIFLLLSLNNFCSNSGTLAVGQVLMLPTKALCPMPIYNLKIPAREQKATMKVIL
jgi:hypothetical protein